MKNSEFHSEFFFPFSSYITINEISERKPIFYICHLMNELRKKRINFSIIFCFFFFVLCVFCFRQFHLLNYCFYDDNWFGLINHFLPYFVFRIYLFIMSLFLFFNRSQIVFSSILSRNEKIRNKTTTKKKQKKINCLFSNSMCELSH